VFKDDYSGCHDFIHKPEKAKQYQNEKTNCTVPVISLSVVRFILRTSIIKQMKTNARIEPAMVLSMEL
jgi:hypothetical protein